jgi:hypothetical protein
VVATATLEDCPWIEACRAPSVVRREPASVSVKAYALRQQLDRLWTYKTRPGVLNFLTRYFKARRWQRLPEMSTSATS